MSCNAALLVMYRDVKNLVYSIFTCTVYTFAIVIKFLSVFSDHSPHFSCIFSAFFFPILKIGLSHGASKRKHFCIIKMSTINLKMRETIYRFRFRLKLENECGFIKKLGLRKLKIHI